MTDAAMTPTGPPLGRLSRRAVLVGTGVAGLLGLTGCTGEPDSAPSGSGPTSTGPSDPASSRGGSPSPGSRTPITFWTALRGDSAAALSALLDQFNDQSSSTEVTYRHREPGEFATELATAVAAGRAPDLALAQAEWVPTMAARRQLQPLTELNSSAGYQPSNFAGPAWLAGAYRDQQYGLPYDVYPLALFYNKTLLSQAGLDPATPPSDAISYQVALDKLKAAGVPAQSVSADPLTGGVSALSLLRQFGGQFLTDEGRTVGWTGEAALKALTWYGDLRGLGYAPDPVSETEDRQRFQTGRVALRWGLSDEIAQYAGASDLSWGVAALPNVGGTAGTWAGSHQFTLPGSEPASAERIRACGDVIAWLLGRSVDWARAGLVPALNTARESREFRALPEVATVASQLDVVTMLPPAAGITDLAEDWYGCLREVVEQRDDPRTALNAATDRARRTLELNLRKYG